MNENQDDQDEPNEKQPQEPLPEVPFGATLIDQPDGKRAIPRSISILRGPYEKHHGVQIDRPRP